MFTMSQPFDCLHAFVSVFAVTSESVLQIDAGFQRATVMMAV